MTKGGLVQPGWVPDGRARHLAEAARESRERLGRIDLYLLHVVDPKVPLVTSVRALAKLREEGVVGAIGLSNVTSKQLEEALAIARIDAVELELSPWRADALRDRLVDACRARGIRVLAHRPFGAAKGAARIGKDATLREIAARVAATPHEVVLAWLRAHGTVPLPGPTRAETARSCARVVALAPEDVVTLDARFAGRAEHVMPAGDREVVVILGMPGAGKTTLAADYVARGYTRLNRDDRGGTLAGLAKELDRVLAGGAKRVVLDNTYPSRRSRAQVIAAARRRGATVRCIVVATTLERAQVQAAGRMLAQHGRLLEPAEIAADPTALPPSAQFRWRRQWEPPRADEGFVSVDEHLPAAHATPGRPALIVELDGAAWTRRPHGADDIALRDDFAERLAGRGDVVVVATTWLPDISADAFVADLPQLPGARVRRRWSTVERRAHAAGPPVCWCRKPMPGMALVLARRHGLDLARSTASPAPARPIAGSPSASARGVSEPW